MNATVEAAPAASSISARRFGIGLGAITAGAFAIRVGAALWYDHATDVRVDAIWYMGVAANIAHDDGFIKPLAMFLGREIPTAEHPPLYPLYLSVVDFAGSNSTLIHRIWSCVPGTATVLLVGLIAREVAGRRAGLIAAALAAVSIELLAQDVTLWSEGMYGFTVALTVFAAYRYLRRPDLLRAGLLAGAIALASLARAEAVLLFLILLVPLILRTRAWTWPRRLGALGVGAAVALVLIGPWLVYNNSGRFEHPVGITVTLGTLLGTSNCHRTYYGDTIGGWGLTCPDSLPAPWPLDESVEEREARHAGLRYMSDHLDRLPLVVPARLGRSFGFFAPVDAISQDLMLEQGNAHRAAYLVLVQYWIMLGLGIAGGVLLFRRGVPLLPLLAPVLSVVVITVIGYGTMRFRMALDVVLPIPAAVAIERLATRWAASR